MKPCLFYQNWDIALKTMQADAPSFESTVSPADHQIPMVCIFPVYGMATPPLIIEYALNIFLAGGRQGCGQVLRKSPTR